MIRNGLRRCGIFLGALAIAGCSEAPFEHDDGLTPNPPLYEIVGSDGEVEGWLLGTIHALPDGLDWRTEAIDDVVEQADFAIVEVANLEDRAALAAAFSTLASSRGHPPLKDRIAPDFKYQLYELVAKSDYSDFDFSTTETWAAALMLARTQATGNPENGVDRAIIRDFSERSVTELEGAFDQLRIFDRLAEEDQKVLLEGVVVEASDPDANPEKLRNAWLTGDETVLEEATRTGIMADPELHRALILDRNSDWAKVIEKTLAKPEKPLIAVGAGHLVGSNSLNLMLEERGFAVRRIQQIPLP